MDLRRTGLPLLPYLPEISSLLESRRALVLSAEPGAGKSTLVPPYLMEEAWMRGRAILMLEPRRLAAAAVAARIAELLGEPVGGRAGYRVRSASRVGPETRIEVVTEALLTRRIQEDPLLEGVGLVIFDEFHERSIHADLGLALALEVRDARPDLAILVMSATLDAGRVSALLGGAPALSCPGRVFPVETVYRPLGGRTRWEEELAAGVADLAERAGGDVLVFLPGVGEIGRTAAALGTLLGGRAEVRALHGTMSLEEQRRVTARESSGASGIRRVILSTSIAETSLTVPGIRAVADSGLARLSRFHPATGMDRLVTERESAASADQRRGRAGRLGPGLCVRFWKESDALLPEGSPEILRSDLAGLVLECALWGAEEPARLRWMDAPPAASWAQGREILEMLGLLSSGKPTEGGRRAAALGLHPRMAAMALAGKAPGLGGMAAACAALLSERDASGLRDDPDLRARLSMLRGGAGGNAEWRARVNRESERILKRTGARPLRWSAGDEERAGALLAGAYPDRIGRRGADGSYRFSSGRAAFFPEHSGPRGAERVQAPSRAAEEWIVAPDADAGDPAGKIYLAAPLDRKTAEQALQPLTEEIRETRWKGLELKVYVVRRAGRLTLEEKTAAPTAAEASDAVRERLRESGPEWLPWNGRSLSLLERLKFLEKTAASPGPDFTGGFAEKLGALMAVGKSHAVSADMAHSALRSALGAEAARLIKGVPETVRLPTGQDRRIDYSSGTPVVEARIQEVFGLRDSPKVCGINVVFKLLSPARRPLQITRDLAGFWKNTYADVRKEMRGRYPKHYWPEDPGKAEPITGVRPKGLKK